MSEPRNAEKELGPAGPGDDERLAETPPSIAETHGYGLAAPVYRAAGWLGVLPLPARRKKLPPTGFSGKNGVDPDDAQIDKWRASRVSGNLALRLPEDVLGVDVDAYDEKVGAQTFADAVAACGPLPATWRSTSRPDDPTSGIRLFKVPEGRQWQDLGPDVEVVHRGWRYVVAWPSIHHEGRQYVWFDPEGEEASGPPKPDELPDLPAAWVERLTKPARERAASPTAPAQGQAATDDRTTRSARAAFTAEVEKVRTARNGEREKVICTQAAFSLGQWVGNGALDRGEVVEAIFDASVACGWVEDQGAEHAHAKITRAVDDGTKQPRPNVTDDRDTAPDLADSPLAEWTAGHLRGRYCWAAGLGWLRYTGKVWQETTDANVVEAVRRLWRKRYADEIRRGAGEHRAKAMAVLLSAARSGPVRGSSRGSWRSGPRSSTYSQIYSTSATAWSIWRLATSCRTPRTCC